MAQPEQAFSLHIRCAIAEFAALQTPANFDRMDLAISMTYDAWVKLLKSVDLAVACRNEKPFESTLQQALRDGGVKVVKGTPEQVQSFFCDYFDPPLTTFQALTLR